jgi:hypothetical protein
MFTAPVRIAEDGAPLLMIGEPEIVLRQEYDPRQAWLPFMRGVLIKGLSYRSEPPSSRFRKRERHRGRKAIREQQAVPFATVDPEHKTLFPRWTEAAQIRLPFPGHHALTSANMRSLRDQGFPDWERRQNGEVCTVPFLPERVQEVEQWCAEACGSYYCVLGNHAYFQSLTEAAGAKLMFYAP